MIHKNYILKRREINCLNYQKEKLNSFMIIVKYMLLVSSNVYLVIEDVMIKN